jgi:hypothetical protein
MKNLLALFLSFCAFAVSAQSLEAYSTYLTAPFFADADAGLANDLVGYLNTRFKGKYSFKLNLLPRERLNLTVLNNPDFDGIVLFMNPQFVDDKDMKKYAWSEAIMHDQNDVVSNLKAKIDYAGPSSLNGKNFVGVRGNRYVGLEELFGKGIQRTDVNTEMQSLMMIANERADVTLLAHSAYAYLTTKGKDKVVVEGKLYVSPTPHLKFDRFMFTALKNKDLAAALTQASKAMEADPKWTAILAKYGLR